MGEAAVWAQITLLVITMLLWAAFGRHAVIIEGGSMSPSIEPGSVVVLDDPAAGTDLVGRVATFSVERGLVTHRIVDQTEEGTFVTKGDANAQADTDRVPVDHIVGVGRVIVPLVGLPSYWIHTHNWLPLALLITVDGALLWLRWGDPRVTEPSGSADVGGVMTP
ncbi:MAG: signal peptidase I [Acidimicrobiales bacterium]